MSEADIETLRRAYDAASRKDWDAALQGMEKTSYGRRSGPGHTTGHEEVRRFFVDLTAAFDEVAFEPEEFVDRAGDQIVVVLRFRARPLDAGAAIENRIGHVWTMRGGKAFQCETFPRREDALEAAGLSK